MEQLCHTSSRLIRRRFREKWQNRHFRSHFCPTEASEQWFSRFQLELKTRITTKERPYAHLNIPTTMCFSVWNNLCQHMSALFGVENAQNRLFTIFSVIFISVLSKKKLSQKQKSDRRFLRENFKKKKKLPAQFLGFLDPKNALKKKNKKSPPPPPPPTTKKKHLPPPLSFYTHNKKTTTQR